MNSVILRLDGNVIRALQFSDPGTIIEFPEIKYFLENVYFGDWVALRNSANKIVGFKLIPFVSNQYLDTLILPAKFIKQATNVFLERKDKTTYISVLIEPTPIFNEDKMNNIEAAIFHNKQDDFIVRLDGFSDGEWSQFGFPLMEH